MRPEAIRAYIRRDWGRLEEATEEHRVHAYRKDPEWAWRTAAALRAAVARANPDWPTEADREADFAHHLELKALIDRINRGLARRRRTR